MKLILNNKASEAIGIENFSRSLDIPDTTVLFNTYFSTNRLEDMPSMNYLTQYASLPITSYKIIDNDDTVISEVTNITAHLTSLNENFNEGSYSANGSFIVDENHTDN